MRLSDVFGDSRPWNMNQAYLMQLDRRREEKAQYAVHANLGAWWSILWEIFESLSGLLTQEEFNERKNSLLKIYQNLSSRDSSTQRGLSRQEQRIAKEHRYTSVAAELREEGLALVLLMFTHDVIYMRHEQKTTEDKLQEGTRNK